MVIPVKNTVVNPVKNSGMVFMFFTCVDIKKVNSVWIEIPRHAGRTVIQGAPKFVDHFELAFPGWSFPCVPLTDSGLFYLIQLPVRKHYMGKIQNYIMQVRPCLGKLVSALIPGSAGNGCAQQAMGVLSESLPRTSWHAS